MHTNIHGLFITHVPVTHLYGAATSLRLYLENNQDFEISLVVPRSLNPLKWKVQVSAQEKKYLGKKIREIHSLFLPIDMCYEGAPKTISSIIIVFIKNLFFYLFKWQFKQLCLKKQYDFIYLNSLTLNTLINEKNKYFIHIREVCDCVNHNRINKISQSRGIIFIDNKTYQPFSNYCSSLNFTILNNPIDMLQLQDLHINYKDFLETLGINQYSEGTKIFSCIGSIMSIKGIDFIIKSFVQAHSANSMLLIVGGSDQIKYQLECQKIASSSNNIYFTGEIRDIGKIYYISDFIVRGDPDFRIGRTIFEGLYSGCTLILPGSTKDIEECHELIPFKNQIYTYLPRNLNELKMLFQSCDKITIGKNKNYISNSLEFAKYLNKFIIKFI